MKIQSTLRFVLGGSLAALVFTHTVQAADGTWTGGNTGTWDTSNTNWTVVGNPAWDAANGPGNKAIFGTVGDVAAISGTVVAGNVQFTETAAVNGAGVIGFQDTTAGMTINTDATKIGSINAGFLGTGNTASSGNRIFKTGSGTLILAGNTILVGDVNLALNAGFTVEGGELQISGGLKAASSLQSNRGNFTNTIGATSGNNTLKINGSSGATVYAGGMSIGANATGTNKVYITRPGNSTTPSYSMAGNGAGLNLGVSSSNNTFEVSNGAYVNTLQGGGINTWTLGTNSGADSNSITVDGTGGSSTIAFGSAAAIAAGWAGSSNSVLVKAGGTISVAKLWIGSNGGNNNFIKVTGTGSSISTVSTQPDFQIGSNRGMDVNATLGSDGNYLLIENGGSVVYDGNQNRGYNIGAVTGADNNYVQVTGVNSVFTMKQGQPLAIGGAAGNNNGAHNIVDSSASGNHLDIYSGAKSFQSTVYVMGASSSVNLGNGTGVSEMEVGHSNGNAMYGAGVVLYNSTARLNINNGRLTAGAIGGTSTNMVSGSGKVDLIGDGYFMQNDQTFTRTISTEITGSGDFTKEGTGTLDLTQINTYTGDTIVAANGGILKMENAYLANGAAVRLFSGGQLDLNTSGATDTIAALYFDGVLQAGGTWGGTGSGATNINTTFFAPNSGKLFVAVIPEPAAALLGGLGMLTLLRRRRLA